MKTKTKFYVITSVLLAFVLLAVVRRFFVAAPAPQAVKENAGPTEGLFNYAIDRTTWNVVDRHNPKADLSAQNTDATRLERYKITLALERPDEYRKQFPPTAKEIEAGEAAMRGIMNPRSVEEVFKSLPPDQERAARESLEKMLHPAVDSSAR